MTSAVTATAVPPACSMSRTVARTESALMSQAATASPQAAALSAAARPIPLPAPVTITASPGVNPSFTGPVTAIIACLPCALLRPQACWLLTDTTSPVMYEE